MFHKHIRFFFFVFQKTLYDKEKPLMMNKIQKLESLCRAMQAERLGRKVMEASNIGKFRQAMECTWVIQ